MHVEVTADSRTDWITGEGRPRQSAIWTAALPASEGTLQHRSAAKIALQRVAVERRSRPQSAREVHVDAKRGRRSPIVARPPNSGQAAAAHEEFALHTQASKRGGGDKARQRKRPPLT